MDQHNDIVYIKHVGDAIERIKVYTKGLGKDDFIQNSLVQDAVVRQLEIIGEALKKVKHGFREKYYEILWEDIIGMRSKLIHDYFGVDLKRVWLVIENDIPVLDKQIKKIILENS